MEPETHIHDPGRRIIHIDMDAFYASVEQRDNPELKGKPVAVGGGSRRGVVAAASYEAREHGVRSAMPGFMAKNLCPKLVFVNPRFDRYRDVSREIRDIFFEYTDLVEPLSLDEAYLDVTTDKKDIGSATLIAKEIRKRIWESLQLTASAGVSFNKFLAKIASDVNKPNGIKVITPKEAHSFLEQLPIEKFHGVGKVTSDKMRSLGIVCGRDLKKWSKIDLVKRFGKVGIHYYYIVRAIDNRPVNPDRVRKSIGSERTFMEDISKLPELKERLLPLVDRVFRYMEKTDNFGRTLTIKMKTSDFKTATRSRSFSNELRELQQLKSEAETLLEEHYSALGPLRLLGFTVSNLSKEHITEGIQLEFDFGGENF